MLHEVFLGQKGYGEKPEDADIRDRYFQRKLGRFTFDQVLEAMDRYTDVKSDIPSPADIIQILDPEPEPLSNSMYVRICKKERESYLSADEKAYKNEFERRELGKAK